MLSISDFLLLALNVADAHYNFSPLVVPISSMIIVLANFYISWMFRVLTPATRLNGVSVALARCDTTLRDAIERQALRRKDITKFREQIQRYSTLR